MQACDGLQRRHRRVQPALAYASPCVGGVEEVKSCLRLDCLAPECQSPGALALTAASGVRRCGYSSS